MKTSKVIFSLFLGIAMLTVQVGSVLAAPALQDGSITVTDLACGTDGTTVIVTYNDNNPEPQEVGISLGTAVALGFLPEGTEICEEALLVGIGNSINPTDLIPAEEQSKHPIGKALAAFFDFTDYDVIMDAHENGTGFGVIAQALWITKNYLKDGSEADFLAILEAKKTGDFSYFSSYFSGDETPANWGQFKKVMLSGDKKNNLGAVMSDKDNKTNNGKGPDKENKSNNSNKDKDKDKNKDG